VQRRSQEGFFTLAPTIAGLLNLAVAQAEQLDQEALTILQPPS
jgi:hypothetical protein